MASLKSGQILIRQFSTTNVRQAGLVKPPIAIFGIEGRYANALFSAASKENKLDAVEKELLKFQEQIKNDTKLAEFLQNPLIKKNSKRDGLVEALTKLNYSKLMVNLIGALAENGRTNYTNAVINAFSRIMSAQRGEILCEVVTAKPLDEALSSQLEAALKSFCKKGEILKISKRVDPEIMGGMVVSIGDKYVDMSIASKIKLYTNVIQQAV